MSKFLCLTAIVLMNLAVQPARAAAGFVNLPFAPGFTYFGNPLLATNNHINQLFPSVPDGSRIFLWNASLGIYSPPATYSIRSGWDVNYELQPGTGAVFGSMSPSFFTNTFVGTVLNHDGTPYPGGGYPPPFSPAAGDYLLSDKSPVSSSGTDIFLNIVGRLPFVGESIARWDASQVYVISQYQGNGIWDPAPPTLGVGEAAFFHLIPEPSAVTLGLLGLATLATHRRRKR